MKLHLLEIQAFGPFAKTETINFDDLGHNPLFLIDGPTGAGKSSILHAICYALYGETTDSDRTKGIGLRSDYADKDLLTQLTLEFSIRQTHYRIQRVPSQMRPTKKGEGETEQKATAELSQVLEDGSYKTLVPKKVTDADQHILSIVGLSAKQFRQVMVLPQGKFRDLLLAKSDDRQEILSTLFQTEIYKQIEQSLKDKAATIERKNASFEKSKQEALEDVTVSNVDNLLLLIAEASTACVESEKKKQVAHTELQTANNVLKTAQDLLNAFKNLEKAQLSYAEWEQQAELVTNTRQVISNAEKALKIVPKWHTLQSLNKDAKAKQIEVEHTVVQLADIDKQLEAVQIAFKEAEKEYQKRDGLKAEQVKLNSYRDSLNTLAKFEKLAQKSNADYEQATHQHVKDKQQLDLLVEQVKTFNLELEKLSQQLLNKAEWVEKRAQTQQQLILRKKLDSALVELANLIKNQQQKNGTLELTRKEYARKRTQAKQLELSFYSQQAALLAAELDGDQACPVCGSFDHPTLAKLADNAPTQAEVEAERESLSKLEQEGSQAKSDFDVAQNSVTTKQTEIAQLEAELGDGAKQSLAVMTQQFNDIELQLKAIQQQKTELTNIKQQLQATQAQQTLLSEALIVLEKMLPELSAAKAKAQTELNNAQAGLPEHYRTLADLDEALNTTQQQVSAIEQAYQVATQGKTKALQQQSATQATLKTLNSNYDVILKAQQDQQALWQQALIESEFDTQQVFDDAYILDETLQAYRSDVKRYDATGQRLKAELGVLEKQVKDKQQPDIAELELSLEKSTQHYKQLEEQWNTAEKYKAKLDDAHSKIKRIENEQGEIKKDYEVIGTLSKAALGKGTIRVSLERFVLGNLLDSVLSIASQRLHIMSKGQYRLIRQNESDQKRNQTAGLDLAIDDAHTGKTRPVATLSGGESFMASLALALGLSDVVQERSGGIQLDTLFIDEGFGSLDQESLQLAIQTLIDLQSTGRTIGIISHVSELKEQMAQRIEVMGTRAGSLIKTTV